MPTNWEIQSTPKIQKMWNMVGILVIQQPYPKNLSYWYTITSMLCEQTPKQTPEQMPEWTSEQSWTARLLDLKINVFGRRNRGGGIVEYIEQQWRTQILANFGNWHQTEFLGAILVSTENYWHVPLCWDATFPFWSRVIVFLLVCCCLQILCIAMQAPALYKLPPKVELWEGESMGKQSSHPGKDHWVIQHCVTVSI